MNNEPLYQDKQLRIDYLQNSDDNLLEIGEEGNRRSYIIPHGTLQDLGRAKRGEVGRVINTINDHILFDLRREGISIDGLHVAFCQAYIEEEKRIKKFRVDNDYIFV
jgi:hypothetical protein